MTSDVLREQCRDDDDVRALLTASTVFRSGASSRRRTG
jgi:hypothetical protein